MAHLDTSRTHHLGIRAFFLFLGWSTMHIVLLLALLFAWWWYGARFVPDAYVEYYVYSVKLFALVIAGYAAYRFAHAFFDYRSHRYRFEKEFFHLEKGYINKHEVGVVYHQIQTVTVERPLGARVVGVAHLGIVTSNSGEGQHPKLHGLDMKKARLIQKELLERARKSQHGGEPQYHQVPFEDGDDEEEDED
jgi:membrane protein YdbS with pleckstrin-like domain